MLFTDGSKFGRAEQLHMGLLGLLAFEKREKRLPEPGNLEEADEVVKLAEEVRKLLPRFDRERVKRVAGKRFNIR